LLLFFFEIIKIINVTKKAPLIENNVIILLPKKYNPEILIDVRTIVAIATNKLAPLLTPNTYGPAKGFRNKLCINKPHKAKAEPDNKQVMTFGKRIVYKIVSNNSLPLSNENKLTLPIHKSETTNKLSMISSKIEYDMNFEFFTKQFILIFYNISTCD